MLLQKEPVCTLSSEDIQCLGEARIKLPWGAGEDAHRCILSKNASYSVRIEHFFLQQLETQLLANKEMRIAINKLTVQKDEDHYSYGQQGLWWRIFSFICTLC